MLIAQKILFFIKIFGKNIKFPRKMKKTLKTRFIFMMNLSILANLKLLDMVYILEKKKKMYLYQTFI